jgi:hypothetical protein
MLLWAWIPVCVAAILPAAAQTIYTGELTGTVTDPSGRAIAGSKVELTSTTGEKSSVATGWTGEFRSRCCGRASTRWRSRLLGNVGDRTP